MLPLIWFSALNRYFHNIMPNASNAVTDGRATGHVFMLVGGYPSSLLFSSREYWNLNLFIPAGLALTKVRATSHQYSSWKSQASCTSRKYHLKYPPTHRTSAGNFAASECVVKSWDQISVYFGGHNWDSRVYTTEHPPAERATYMLRRGEVTACSSDL